LGRRMAQRRQSIRNGRPVLRPSGRVSGFPNDVASLDVDDGPTIMEGLQNPLVGDNAAILSMTVQHRADARRYRIVSPRYPNWADSPVSTAKTQNRRDFFGSRPNLDSKPGGVAR
jgi:hypothetical protein